MLREMGYDDYEDNDENDAGRGGEGRQPASVSSHATPTTSLGVHCNICGQTVVAFFFFFLRDVTNAA